MAQEQFAVEHQPDNSRYALIDQDTDGRPSVIGEESYLDVSREDARERILYHTEVSEDYAGQGLATILVRSAVEQSIADGYRIVPVCPYVVKWIEKHPEYNDHVVKADTSHMRALATNRG